MLVKFHTLKHNTGRYDPADLVWINPAFVVSVNKGHRTGEQQHSRIRLAGDMSPQDWIDVWESPENVAAFVSVVATHAD